MQTINYVLNNNEQDILLNYFTSQTKNKPNSKKNYIDFINSFLEKHNLKYSKKDIFINGKRQVHIDEFYSKDIHFNLMWNEKNTFFEHLVSLNYPLSNTKLKAYSRFNPDWNRLNDKGNNILHQIALNPFHHRIMAEILKELKFDPNSLNLQGETYHVLFFKNFQLPASKNNDPFSGALDYDLITNVFNCFQEDQTSKYLSVAVLDTVIKICEKIPEQLTTWLNTKKNMNYDLIVAQIQELDHRINFLKLTHSLPEQTTSEKLKAKI